MKNSYRISEHVIAVYPHLKKWVKLSEIKWEVKWVELNVVKMWVRKYIGKEYTEKLTKINCKP